MVKFGRNLNVFFFMYLFIYVMNKIVLRNVYDLLENFDDMVKYINCMCCVFVKYVWFNCIKCIIY